jgi:hypothetical protein
VDLVLAQPGDPRRLAQQLEQVAGPARSELGRRAEQHRLEEAGQTLEHRHEAGIGGGVVG